MFCSFDCFISFTNSKCSQWCNVPTLTSCSAERPRSFSTTPPPRGKKCYFDILSIRMGRRGGEQTMMAARTKRATITTTRPTKKTKRTLRQLSKPVGKRSRALRKQPQNTLKTIKNKSENGSKMVRMAVWKVALFCSMNGRNPCRSSCWSYRCCWRREAKPAGFRGGSWSSLGDCLGHEVLEGDRWQFWDATQSWRGTYWSLIGTAYAHPPNGKRGTTINTHIQWMDRVSVYACLL